jgi:hypothetical protein
MPTLNWQELAGDLRLARHFCDQILIHSPEGCVWQRFLPRLRSFDWANADRPAGWRTGRQGPAQKFARDPVGERTSLAAAGHNRGRGLARLALALRMTFCSKDRTLPYWKTIERPGHRGRQLSTDTKALPGPGPA